MKKVLTLLAAAPLLALLGGVGVMSYTIGQSWTSADTQTLVAGLVSACMVGGIILGTLLALLVGIPLAIRAYGEAGRARQQWPEFAPPGPLVDGQWQLLPPPNGQPPTVPPWQVTGGGHVDLMPADQRLLADAHERFWMDKKADKE
jgi:hypothetical protein